MARSADPDSAGSQFFVCLTREKCQHLDGKYTGFGRVIEGMDVVEKLGAVECGPNDVPREKIDLKSIKPLETTSADE